MSIEIKNKTIVVTGANRGIGKAVVETFLAHGAKKIYLAVRNLESVNPLTAQYGKQVEAVYVNLDEPESIKALATKTQDAEIVVNNAGVLIPANLLSKQAEASLNKELNINTYGLLRMAQAYTPILEKHPEAAFIQLNSVASIKNFADFTTYSASKAAAYSITQGLKDNWSEKGIHILSVHPGPIDTEMAHKAGIGELAEPSSVVSEGIVKALQTGEFHLFPDTIAKNIESVYKNYAINIIEPLPQQTEAP
ncbi:3-oxoacyl-[acyl-carrier protein] reductase [hydrothermal vent metagenome]|uniref:3-oxoacyl-[acyl-carrier protein] reductase n=1 Tax=hydrothermal vent metagenome TaxID=652676 RepID=A0A3B0VYU2_9ZZZZ